MTYQEAIAVRKRQIAGQPVDRDELAQANRKIEHERAMGRVFPRNESRFEPPRPTSAPVAAQPRAALPHGCISVTEWPRTLRPSESYRTPRRP